MKNNKGITLLALIITIIVMMILAGVSMTMLFGENGVVTKSQDASRELKRQAEIERVMTDIYFNKNTAGKKIKDETVKELAIRIVDEGLDLKGLVVVYEVKDGEEHLAYIYNEDMTIEEKMKLESQGIYLLKGDVNEDEIIDGKDLDILRKISLLEYDFRDYNITVCDMNGDGFINAIDVTELEKLIYGEKKLLDIINQSTDFSSLNIDTKLDLIRNKIDNVYYSKYKQYLSDKNNKIIKYIDKKTGIGHVVYRYDLVTEEERKIIESIDEYKTKAGYFVGVKMLKGDANLDGNFKLDDINLIEENLERNIDFTSTQITIIDMNNNNKVDEEDIEKLTKVLNEDESMYLVWDN